MDEVVPAPWAAVLTYLGIPHTVRASGTAVLLCRFHDERTPSLWAWKSGNFLCHGCQTAGNLAGFVALVAGTPDPGALIARAVAAAAPEQLPLPLRERYGSKPARQVNAARGADLADPRGVRSRRSARYPGTT